MNRFKDLKGRKAKKLKVEKMKNEKNLLGAPIYLKYAN